MDIESLLRCLNARSAEYVVIGATAFPAHGYARATLDIDLFIRPTPDNAARVRAALIAFGYDLSDVSLEDLIQRKILIRQYVIETDIHPFVKGVRFEDVWARRVEDRLGETPTSFASLDDLITMKEAAGRPKDLEDLRVLRELRLRRSGGR